MSAMPRRRGLVACVATGLLVAAAPAAGASALPALVRGGMDVDVRLGDTVGSGGLVGTVHGSVTSAGRGFAAFRAASGQRRLGVVIGVRARLAGSGAQVRLRGRGLTGTVRVTADGRASGRGVLKGTRVNLSGVIGEKLPRLGAGMRMLVVGTPSGEAWEALKTRWRPVAFDPAQHGRRALLSDREGFHGFAAVVFGAGLSAGQIAASPVLHSFVNGGKWVIVAPATPARLDGLAAVIPFDPGVASPGIAMRATGREGGLDTVKAVLPFPAARGTIAATGGRARIPAVSAASEKDAANRRRSFFLSRLERLSPANLATARRAPKPGTKTAASSSSGALPANSAAIEITVPYYHAFTMTGTQNAANFGGCAYDRTNQKFWCSDSATWRQRAGSSGSDALAACRSFLSDSSPGLAGYWWLLQGSADYIISSFGIKQASDGSYPMALSKADPAFFGETCPADGTQTGVVTGEDTYTALYNPDSDQHTLLVLSDPTVSASVSGSLFQSVAPNGSGLAMKDCDAQFCSGMDTFPASFRENAWFLGKYSYEVSVAGGAWPDGTPNRLPSAFKLDVGSSFPGASPTTDSTTTTSSSTSQSFQFGVFGSDPTLGYTSSQDTSVSVQLEIPDWMLTFGTSPLANAPSWTTNQDALGNTITFDDMAGGAASSSQTSPFAPNPLNLSGLGPTALSVFGQAKLAGPVTVTNTKTVSVVDHYSFFNQGLLADQASALAANPSAPFSGIKNAYLVTPIEIPNDDPNGITSQVTSSPVGPGVNFCDPAVMAPSMESVCLQHYPEPLVPPKR